MRLQITIPKDIEEKWKAGLLTIDEAKRETAKEYLLNNMKQYEKKSFISDIIDNLTA